MDEAALDAQNEVEVVEQYEISDDEAGELDYDAVEAPDDEDDDDDDDDEDLPAALARRVCNDSMRSQEPEAR